MPPIAYPSQETRWKTYGEPLGKIFNGYFDERSFGWYKDNNGKLDLIIVTCYGAKFSYWEWEERTQIDHLVHDLSSEIESFFKQFETKASIVDVMEPIPSSLQEFATLQGLRHTNFEKYKDIKLHRKFEYLYDFLTCECKGEGSAIGMAEGLIKKFVADGVKQQVRINKEHPNVVESLNEKTGEWKTAIVFTDPKNRYVPKGYDSDLLWARKRDASDNRY